ncbi:uncharacterized protein soul5l isoform X2 [Hoplias malabaricus]|uniref:uncharacterized protein soul5l isoform X2 n=1 Tax=Hoplias malabaricus TaxID=27720 RepID=UPI0034629629
MFLRPFWFALVLGISLADRGVGWSNSSSSFCTESRECLQFELICRTDEYEVRHYSPTRWVSTDAEAYFMGVGAAMAFRRLYQYITGANEGGVEIEMTAPVLVKVPQEMHMWEPALYTLSFLLPSAFQHHSPTPSNDKLYFIDMPEMDVYVRSYGGWMLSKSSRLYAQLLITELNRINANYNHTHHYAVGYDSPLKLLNRHNEVWYVAEGEPVCNKTEKSTATEKTTDTETTTKTATEKTATEKTATTETTTETATEKTTGPEEYNATVKLLANEKPTDTRTEKSPDTKITTGSENTTTTTEETTDTYSKKHTYTDKVTDTEKTTDLSTAPSNSTTPVATV